MTTRARRRYVPVLGSLLWHLDLAACAGILVLVVLLVIDGVRAQFGHAPLDRAVYRWLLAVVCLYAMVTIAGALVRSWRTKTDSAEVR